MLTALIKTVVKTIIKKLRGTPANLSSVGVSSVILENRIIEYIRVYIGYVLDIVRYIGYVEYVGCVKLMGVCVYVCKNIRL